MLVSSNAKFNWLVAVFMSQVLLNPTEQTDKGLIGFFEDDCPEGWSVYENGVGRVIVGAGNYSGINENGEMETKEYISGEYSGEMYHTLTEEELPTHNHNNGTFMYLLQSNGNFTFSSSVTSGDYNKTTIGEILEPNLDSVKAIKSVGKNASHNNLQPYYVLNACIKIENESKIETINQQLLDLQNLVLNLTDRLNQVENDLNSDNDNDSNDNNGNEDVTSTDTVYFAITVVLVVSLIGCMLFCCVVFVLQAKRYKIKIEKTDLSQNSGRQSYSVQYSKKNDNSNGVHHVKSKYDDANNENTPNGHDEQRVGGGVEDNGHLSSDSVLLNLQASHSSQPGADDLNVSPPSVNMNKAMMLKSVSGGSAVD